MVKKLQINLGNKTFYTLIAIAFVLIIAGVVFAIGSKPNPGHAITELQTCNEGETLKVVSGNWECGSGSGGTTFTCPSGFTKVTNQGQVLGCIQNAEKGNSLCTTAISDCWSTYGGRLPSWNEAYIAFKNYGLTDESDGYEWTDEGIWTSSYDCGLIVPNGGSDWLPHRAAYNIPEDYRCFIPASGTSGGATCRWVNSGGIQVTEAAFVGNGGTGVCRWPAGNSNPQYGMIYDYMSRVNHDYVECVIPQTTGSSGNDFEYYACN